MKSRRLTETDLANMAFKPVATKRLRLTSIEKPKPIPGSYEPFRRSNGDAVNLQLPLLPSAQERTALAQLEAVVAKACKGDAELLAMNLPIARSTHEYADANGITATKEDVRRLILPFGHRYDFGMPLLMAYPQSNFVAVFPDLRRTDPLTEVGHRVVFSFMHQRWRESNPDFAMIGLQAWRYRNCDSRAIKVYDCAEQDLIPYDQLIADVRQTYDIWHEVLQEAAMDRRKSGGGTGPLFGSGI